MIILDVNNLSKDFGYGSLFEDLSFSLNEGESISIVGPNGCGKSTLIKIIAGLERADKGTVSIKKDCSVAYLDQTASNLIDDRCVYDILKEAFEELNQMEVRLNFLQQKLNTDLGDETDTILNQYCNLLDRFSLCGGYDRDVAINTVCEGLKIDSEMMQRSYNLLSGGEKTLVHLAKSLLLKPNLFLLDEPTNHLDIERIEWLEGYLKSFKGATVIVSHDRYFLDRMSNKILAMDNFQTKIYCTNYTGYLQEFQRDFDKQMTDYKNQQLVIKRLEEQIKYYAERGMATNSSTLCDRAHSLQTQLERIKQKAVVRPRVPKKLNIEFDMERKSSKRIVEAKNLSVATESGKKILDKVNLHICAGEHVALIGANGSGKSTFVKSVLGLSDLKIEGEIFVGPSVKIGYLPQVISFGNDNERLLDYFRMEVCVSEENARRILYNFQFYKDDLDKRVKNLSGGEKIKVKMAELLQQKMNVLIFDEPTNHIDIPTKEVLEQALDDFSGTLIFVSHDRYFINKFAEKTIEFKNGKVTTFIGDYDYYKQKRQD